MNKSDFLAILLIASCAVTAANAAPMTVEDVISLKQVTAARMSPDGDKIAYLLDVPREIYVDIDGLPYRELHIVDLSGDSRAYVTGDVEITSFAWSADGKSVYFVAKRDPDALFNSLFRIPVGGGEAEQVFTHVNSIGSVFPAPNGRSIAFTATDAPPEKDVELKEKGFKAIVYEESVPPIKVWILDLDTNEAIDHELPGSASHFAWSADSRQYAVALAPTPLVDDSFTARDIHIVDAASGDVRSKIGSVGKLGQFAFSPDGERIGYLGSNDIHDPAEGRLYVASTSGGERRELVPEYLGHVSHFVWESDASVRWIGGRGLWTDWAAASTFDTRPAGPAPTSGPILRTMHGFPGQSAWAAIADTPEHPPEVYVLRDGREPERLTYSNPGLSDRQLAKQEAITYEARDGLELEAILIHPLERPRGGAPLVVIAHGGPESHFSNGWLTSYSRPGQVLAAKGYAVIYPNYRGSTGRGVAFSQLGQHDYAEEEFNDLVDAKRHLVSEGLVNAEKVGITGGSYGGYASMWSASALTEEYAAAVAFVGISNQISKFGTGDIPKEMYNVHARAWPWDDWMWMLQRSPVYHAGNTRTPLLIMGGDKDPRVHPGQSLEMYRFVKLRTDTPVRLVIYPDEVHGNRNTAARYDYVLRLLRWMDHYLQGPGGAPPPYEIDHAARLAEIAADPSGE